MFFENIQEENQVSLKATHKFSRAIDALPFRPRQAINLRNLQELTYDEFLELHCMQILAIFNLISRGIKSIK